MSDTLPNGTPDAVRVSDSSRVGSEAGQDNVSSVPRSPGVLHASAGESSRSESFLGAANIVIEPFEHQLSHPSPERHQFIREHIRPTQDMAALTADQTTGAAFIRGLNPAATAFFPSQALAFLPSLSSTGFTLSSLPIITTAEKNHPSNLAAKKQYIEYMQLGYIEITDELISQVCPADLNGIPCPHDSLFEWDWINDCWKPVNCGMIRLCEQLHRNPPPSPPPFTMPRLMAGPEMLSHRFDNRVLTTDTIQPDIDNPRYLKAQHPGKRAPASSLLPIDHEHHTLHCPHLHSMQQTCNSLRGADLRRQTCRYINRDLMCLNGHDLQSARVESLRGLTGHKAEAKGKRGRPGVVFVDVRGRWCWERRGVTWRIGAPGYDGKGGE